MFNYFFITHTNAPICTTFNVILYFFKNFNGISIFFFIWSFFGYVIGYKSRKDYVLRRKMFKENFSLLDDKKFNKVFRIHYVSEQAKILSIVFLTAIPWYILGYTNESISKENIIIVISMGTLSLICFLISKKLKQIYSANSKLYTFHN